MRNKAYISLLLAGLLCLHSWQLSMIVLNYEYNQEMFVRLFCENQDMPEMQCNGQCFLQESMDHAQHDQGTHGHEIKLNWSPLFVLEPLHDLHNSSPYYLQRYVPYQHPAHQLILSQDIFHPPRYI